jgi:AcrR family transcriptional regulator
MTKTRDKPSRRRPRQRRSKETVAAIVEAAARVFAEVGVEQATTNEIAEVAGVSIGSLYQYFPNKRALLEALYDRESERLHEVFLRMVGERGVDDVPGLIHAFIAETLALFEANAALYRVLLDEVPRSVGLDLNYRIDDRAIAALRPLLAVGVNRIQPSDPDIAARLIVWTYRYNTVAALRQPMTPSARKAFVDELTAMLCQYLLAPRGG